MSYSPESLAEALPKEIKRVQAKKERWLEYERDAKAMPGGNPVMFGPALMMMQMSIDEGVASLASGDVVRMIAAYQDLQDHPEND